MSDRGTAQGANDSSHERAPATVVLGVYLTSAAVAGVLPALAVLKVIEWTRWFD